MGRSRCVGGRVKCTAPSIGEPAQHPQSEPHLNLWWKCLCLRGPYPFALLGKEKASFHFGVSFDCSWWKIQMWDNGKTYPDQHRAMAMTSLGPDCSYEPALSYPKYYLNRQNLRLYFYKHMTKPRTKGISFTYIYTYQLLTICGKNFISPLKQFTAWDRILEECNPAQSQVQSHLANPNNHIQGKEIQN